MGYRQVLRLFLDIWVTSFAIDRVGDTVQRRPIVVRTMFSGHIAISGHRCVDFCVAAEASRTFLDADCIQTVICLVMALKTNLPKVYVYQTFCRIDTEAG